jgi:Fe-Mn family superoxide dismutase
MMLDRRQMLGAAGLLAGTAADAASAQPAAFEIKPLPFDPKAVPGLSEKLLVSHHDNNYAGAVRRLGQIRAELAGLDMASAPGYRLNGLKREELVAWNSMILHELYFAGLGAQAAPSRELGQAVERDFGSHDKWAAEFSAIGKALGGGSGWVLLTWSRRDRRLVNAWAADHTMTLADGAPILALDMYEHAYAMDYGARAAGYVDAFMKAMTWTEANRRFAAAG